MVQLDQPVSSWSDILDHQRIASTSDLGTVGAAQLAAVLPPLDERPIVRLDRLSIWALWLHATATLTIDQCASVPAATRCSIALHHPTLANRDDHGSIGRVSKVTT